MTNKPAGIEAVAHPKDTGEESSLRDAISASELPDKVQSFFYVDVRGGLGLVEQLSGAPIPAAVKRNVKPLRSAVEYAASRPSELQFTFFVRIDDRLAARPPGFQSGSSPGGFAARASTKSRSDRRFR